MSAIIELPPVSKHPETFDDVAPEPSPLPGDASPEQKDLHWYTHVYRGDSVPQLTLRAVAMGAMLGMLMSVSNLNEALRKAYVLVAALVAGVVVGVLNTAEDQFAALGRFFAWMKAHLFDVHLPDLVPADGFRLLAGKPMVAFGFEPSALLIAAGMIVGLRVSLSMLAASVVLFFFVAPWLQSLDALNASVPGYVASIPLVAGGTLFHPVRWALWGGASVLVFASLASLALQWRCCSRSSRRATSRTTSSRRASAPTARRLRPTCSPT
jgi:uncharacterized oligopeptide transporter (OPT) family protein